MDKISTKPASTGGLKDVCSPLSKLNLTGKPSLVSGSWSREAAAVRKLTDNDRSTNNSSSSGSSSKGSSRKTTALANDSTGTGRKIKQRLQHSAEASGRKSSSAGTAAGNNAAASVKPRARSRLFANTSNNSPKNATTVTNTRYTGSSVGANKRSSAPSTFGGAVAPSTSRASKHNKPAIILATPLLPASTAQLSSTVVSRRSEGLSPSFLELPDVSAIKMIDSSVHVDSSTSPDLTMPSSTYAGIGPIMEETLGSLSQTRIQNEQSLEVSQQDLDVMYLNYQTWVHINVSTAAAHATAMEPVKKEISFLEELVAKKQQENSELRQNLKLNETLETALLLHDKLLPLLANINDGSSWCSNLQALTHQLENHLHQVTLAPAVLPDTADEICTELRATTGIIWSLLEKAPPRITELLSATSVLHDAYKLQRCDKDVQEASCLVLERCSLEFTPALQATD